MGNIFNMKNLIIINVLIGVSVWFAFSDRTQIIETSKLHIK